MAASPSASSDRRRAWQAVLVGFALSSVVGCTSVEPDSSARTGQPVVTVTPESPSAEQTASRSPSIAPSPTPTQSSAARAVLALVVKGRSAKTGYSREQFGPAWVDINRNGCDTRNDMLIKDLTERRMSGSCKVLAGTLHDPYTARTIRFVRGGASEVDVDHIVSLSDAWQKGAARWPYAKRVAFANDPLGLQPTDASANRQKGDSDAASWLPPNKSYRCAYVARQVAVKKKYRIWVNAAERNAMLTVLRKCPDQRIPSPGSQPTIASNTGGPPPSARTTSPPRFVGSGGGTDPRFRTCGDANAAGYGPYYEGKDPEYAWYQDRDGDGIDCER